MRKGRGWCSSWPFVTVKQDKLRKLIAAGSQIAGSIAGSAIASLVGGVGGAVIGGAAGSVLSTGITDLANRVLSDREQIRVGATAAYAIDRIRVHLEVGDVLRRDGFFEAGNSGRPAAEEILEGVLLKAKNEHEEKKTQILGNIFANVAFMPGFSVGEANHLLRIAETLIYRQMGILSLVKRKDEIRGINLRREWYGVEKATADSVRLDFSTENASVLQQCYELCNLGLMICASSPEDITMTPTAFDVIPDELILTAIGRKYYGVMGLDDIPEGEIRALANHLS